MNDAHGQMAKIKLGMLRYEVHQILKYMRQGDMDKFKSMEAIEALGVARDLREAADMLEANAKDYTNEN